MSTTRPEDRIAFPLKVAYGLGAFVNNLLAAAIGGMMIILNLGLGMNPAVVGLLGALPRAADALMDPLMGYVSDHTRSRWGRRRPYIFAGALLSGVTFIALWFLPTGRSETFYFWYFLVGSTVFYGAYTVFAAPWVALGYELTPDYHERTRLMGVQNFIGQIAYLVSPWFLWIMTNKAWFADGMTGARGLAIGVGVLAMVLGVLPAIFLRERFSAEPAVPVAAPTSAPKAGLVAQMMGFVHGCRSTLRSKNFRRLCYATFLVFNGFIMISSFQSYVIIYYVFGGDQALGAKYAGYAGTLGTISTFVIITIVTSLATRIGKRKAFFVSTGTSMVGYALKWFSYNPKYPWLVLVPAPLMAFGLGGLFTLMGSMIADVCDTDELQSRERREGMFGSIYWWVVKVGMAAALAGGGYLLNATGFDVALGGAQSEQTITLIRLFDAGIPFLTSGLAIWIIAGYDLTEEKAGVVRAELEVRRQAEAPATAPVAPTVDERVEALLSRMTIPQKVGQLMMPERMSITPDDVRAYHIGAVLSGGGSAPGANHVADWIAMNDAYWAASMAEGPDRTPIPVLYAVDAIHGHANVLGATVMPHNIGLGCAHDPALVERTARVMAAEVLATGVDWTFAPTLAVAGNPHWGRTYESFSDDPTLVASYAGAYVRGVQGAHGDSGVLACAKHWVGDGGTTDGHDQGDTVCSEAELERVHMAPYLPALEAGVYTVMASYSSWNGEKCHGHRYLLTDVLKGRLGFDGLVVTDWDGVNTLHEDYATAIATAINAGVDMLMVSVQWKACLGHLTAAVERGVIPVARLDDAVRRVLRVKVRAGLFERPRPALRPQSGAAHFGSDAHRAVAREAVRRSLVLLKHEHDVLPVARSARVLVAGKSAHNRGHQCGGFTVAWQGVTGNDQIVGGTSIWEGIQAVAPQAVLSPDGSAADTQHFDAAIVVIGERPYAEGMGDLRRDGHVAAGSQRTAATGALTPYGTTLELASLHPEDLALLQSLRARGLPIITIFVGGRPLVVAAELEASDAFIAAWLPGSEGQGVADVLFGDADFHGRLSFRWPAVAGEQFASAPPQFPRGFGLRVGTAESVAQGSPAHSA